MQFGKIYFGTGSFKVTQQDIMKTLVITDNKYLLDSFISIVNKLGVLLASEFVYACSPGNVGILNSGYSEIDVKKNWREFIDSSYQLVISLHCKQLFPKEMINYIRCVNIHPGYNPYNRGWYPQVFSILNKLPLGATIHEIDEDLDHGPIIAQMQVKVTLVDTSLTAYNKVLQAELKLIEVNLVNIINNTYLTSPPEEIGNLNLKKDFNKMLEIDINELVRTGDLLDRLRALTHGEYNNAYFIDEVGNKVFVGLTLKSVQGGE